MTASPTPAPAPARAAIPAPARAAVPAPAPAPARAAGKATRPTATATASSTPCDNCPDVSNPDQAENSDHDGRGDACEKTPVYVALGDSYASGEGACIGSLLVGCDYLPGTNTAKNRCRPLRAQLAAADRRLGPVAQAAVEVRVRPPARGR